MKEIFKKVKGYPDYEVSNLGRVKSFKKGEERILKSNPNSGGYLQVNLYKDNKRKGRTIHSLVAEAFLNHTPNGHKLVVNHIDFNPLNNNVNNLEIVTQRKNTNLKHIKSSSIYTGVTWHKKANKWISQIRIKGKKKYLGLFTNELQASNSYQKALKQHLDCNLQQTI